jgi:uncharacterized membrane protein YqjE
MMLQCTILLNIVVVVFYLMLMCRNHYIIKIIHPQYQLVDFATSCDVNM